MKKQSIVRVFGDFDGVPEMKIGVKMTWSCNRQGMNITTVSSRGLNHDVSSAKKAAKDGPVIITDRGKPSHVLMTYGEFERLTGKHRSLAEACSAWLVGD
jgi:prevent-host-death family protein